MSKTALTTATATAATALHLGPAAILGLGTLLLVAFLAMLLVSAVVSGRNAAGFAAILEAWAHLLHPGRPTSTPSPTSENHNPSVPTGRPSGDDQHHQHRTRRRSMLEAGRRARPGQPRRHRTQDPRR